MRMLLFDFVKLIFAAIDRMVASVIGYLYQLIVAIADTNVFGVVIYQYLGRIYTFLGIFMVFKLSITMINYIVNPDALTDKGKGFGKLISNVIISLILLVATPTLFNVAIDIQSDILNTNALYQIVTGRKVKVLNPTGQQNTLRKNAKISGETIAYGVYSAFVYDESINDETSDSAMYVDGDDSNSKTPVKVNCDPKSENCPSDTSKCPYGDVDCLLDNDTVTHENNTYWWLLSTIVGVAVAYILLTFCLDIALRSVKLGFLQIVAPIPIMMRMDPGAKDDKFSKWLKEVSSTFLSLFVRLAGLFFVTEIIRLIMNREEGMMTTYSDGTDLLGGGGLTGLFVRLFIIIGCLMFAKKLPQLVSDLFGIKLDGEGFSLKKKLSGLPGMGAAKVAGAGALGFAGGVAANAIGAGKTWKATDGNWLKKLGATGGSIFAGGTSAMVRGMTSKDKNMFRAASSGIKGAVDKRELRDKRQAAGYTLIDRIGDSIKSFGGVDGVAKQRSDETYAKITNLQRQQAQYDRIAEEALLANKWNDIQVSKLNDFVKDIKINKEGKFVKEIKLNGKMVEQIVTDADMRAVVGSDAGRKYIESVAKSNDASVKIAKENKNLKLYQKEDKSKG